MKKLFFAVIIIAVAVMFAGLADAATSCRSCAKPCKPCVVCPKPCKPCVVCPRPCRPCVPCEPICVEYKRDVLGNKVPVYTYNKDGGALTDKATQYEDTLISGQ